MPFFVGIAAINSFFIRLCPVSSVEILMHRTLFARFVYSFVKRLVYLFYIVFFRGSYINANLLPKEGAVLIACNHQSHLDPPIIGAGLTRYLSFMARDTLFKGWFGKYISLLSAFPIDREHPLGGIKETLRRLKMGEAVVVFPEGSRTYDGELQKFLPGLVAIAQKTKTPILPAAIEGAFDAMPRQEKGKFHLFRPIRVKFSEMIPVETVVSLSTEELLALVRKRVAENLNELRQLPPFKEKPQIPN